MTERKSIDALFDRNAKYTKDEFKAKYLELKEAEAAKTDSMSIFASDLEVSIENIFDTLNTSGNKTLDAEEIDVLLNNFKDKDQTTVSEGDLDKLYKDTLARLEKQNIDTKNPETITARRLSIEALISARQQASRAKITALQNELTNIIYDASNLSSREKNEYQNNVRKIQKQKNEKEEKEQELKSKQEELKDAQLEIDYIKEHKKLTEKTQNELKEWTNKYSKLENECNKISAKISKIDSKINALYLKNQQITDKSNNEKTNLEQRKNNLNNSIKAEEEACRADTQSYNSQILQLEKTERAAYKANTVAYPKEYYDEDTSNFSYDAQELKSKWSKSQPKLSDAFYNKVVAVSKRVGCDPNALMAVIKLECSFNHKARNKDTNAYGLIQFMPSTAKKVLKKSMQELQQMSPEEQLNEVEKYLMYAKTKVAGIKSNEKIDGGTLYMLVFMPGKANQNVFAKKGTKAYKLNEGLDKDGDWQITKADLTAKVRMNMK